MTGARDATRSRRWWFVFAAVTTLVTGALSWITVEMVRLEKAELAARYEATHQESLRLALWRTDSWFAPYLAREAARQYVVNQVFFPQERAYTRLLCEIEPGKVLTPSPLLQTSLRGPSPTPAAYPAMMNRLPSSTSPA